MYLRPRGSLKSTHESPTRFCGGPSSPCLRPPFELWKNERPTACGLWSYRREAMVWFFADPQTGVAPGWPRGRHLRSRCRCSMCSAIHINSRSWLRSSSTHEPSDPPLKVVFFCFFHRLSVRIFFSTRYKTTSSLQREKFRRATIKNISCEAKERKKNQTAGRDEQTVSRCPTSLSLAASSSSRSSRTSKRSVFPSTTEPEENSWRIGTRQFGGKKKKKNGAAPLPLP